jgi:replicative DNA helicase
VTNGTGRNRTKDGIMNKEEAKEHIKSNPQIYFKPARKKGYVCPLCQNGTGSDGTGIEEIPDNKGHFKCFKCNEGGDVLHFIGKEYGITSFPEILEKAFSIYGIIVEEGKNKRKEDKKEMQKITEPQTASKDEDFRDFYKEAKEKLNKEYELNKTNYLKERGISIETRNRFKIGYVEDWISPTTKKAGKNLSPSPRVIIPTSDSSYVARDTRADIKEYKIVKEGKSHLFNLEALAKESNEPIFVVEGKIDALSVIEAGGEAIGLGGVSNINLLISELGKKGEEARKHPFIICLDNDKAGEDESKKLQEMLKTKGFAFEDKSKEMPCIMRPLTENKESADRIKAYCKDPNEALVEKKEEFKSAIKNVKTQATKNFEKKREEERENYIQEYVDKILGIAEYFFIEKNPIETGLTELDKFLDGGLYAGLYILVAAPSAGKTTFALQIADNMAKAGQDVLFFSGEMTINEMVAKSVSRLSKETSKDDSKDALTMRTVLNVAKSNNSDYEKRVTNLTVEVYSKLPSI